MSQIFHLGPSEIRYIIIAKQCEVTGKLLILDGCLKTILDGCLKISFSSVYDLGKLFFGHPSRIDDFSSQPNTVLL